MVNIVYQNMALFENILKYGKYILHLLQNWNKFCKYLKIFRIRDKYGYMRQNMANILQL